MSFLTHNDEMPNLLLDELISPKIFESQWLQSNPRTQNENKAGLTCVTIDIVAIVEGKQEICIAGVGVMKNCFHNLNKNQYEIIKCTLENFDFTACTSFLFLVFAVSWAVW